MAKTFLERARELQERLTKNAMQNNESGIAGVVWEIEDLRSECWPELIALVEAAEHEHAMGNARPALCAALAALDQKASE